MTTVYEVPLTPSTPQSLTTMLGDVYCTLRLIWLIVGQFPGDLDNVEEGGWLLDVYDTEGNPLACGIPLVTGEDIFAQFPELGLPPTWVATDGDPNAVPTFSNIGVLSHLYFLVN